MPVPVSVEKDNVGVLIGVMGATGSGKSTFINLLSASGLTVGAGLKSCTSEVETSDTFELAGRHVTLIDTPGFDDTMKSDTDILKMIAIYLSSSYQAGIKLSGIIYMHRISDFRVGGTSRRNFRMFRKLCGDETLRNVTIVTNMWSEVTPERGAARERELATDDVLFKPVLDEGATMERHDGSLTSAQEIVRRIINNTPLTLRVQREIVDEKKDIKETAAGIELDRELAALRAQHKKELAEVREEMEEALAANDLKAKKELEQVRANLEGNIARIEGDRERLSREFAEEKARADATIKEIRGELANETSERKKREEEMGKLRGDMKTFQENATREQEQLRAQLRAATRRRRTGWGEAIGGLTGLIFGGLPGGHIVGGIGRAIDSATGPRE